MGIKDFILKYTSFDKLDPEEKKVLFAWFIIGLILVILIAFFFIKTNETKEEKKVYDDRYLIVKDLNRFYTVSGTISKYYSFLATEEYSKALKTLDNDYVKENKIDENKLKELTNNEKKVSFNTRIMCSRTMEEGIVNYLVSGFEEESNTGKRLNNKYYLITLNEKEFHFVIKPVDENTFGGACNG